MSYSEDLKAFAASHKYQDVMVDGAKFHYVLNGRKDSQTLVMLNGGMNTLEMWMNYVDASRPGFLFRQNAGGPDSSHA